MATFRSAAPTVSRAVALALTLASGAAALSLADDAVAQARKDSVVLGMVLEPAPGLDPTVAPCSTMRPAYSTATASHT